MNSRKITLIILSLLLLISFSTQADDKKTFRAAYFEGGGYYFHKLMLMELKTNFDIINDNKFDIIYEPYGYKSAEWNREKCKAMANDLARMNNIDFVIAAGPWVIEDLLEAGFEKPIIGIYQFDVRAAGLVDSKGRPIADNLTVNWRPGKIASDITAMLKLFPSKNIGLLYFPSGDETSKISALVRQAAGDKSIVHVGEKSDPSGLYSFFLSNGEIKDSIDVLYLPPLYGMELDEMKQFFKDCRYARLPTFTSEGYGIVEKGATAANCNLPFRLQAIFSADKIFKILDGAEPASLPTIFDDVPELCLNLEEANHLKVHFKRSTIYNARIIPALPGDSVPQYNLTGAINQALMENAGLLLRGELYNQIVAVGQKSGADFYPHLSADISAALADNESEAAMYNESFNRKFAADIVLDQKLFSFPAIKAIKAAQKRTAMAKNSLEQAKADLKYAVTVAYLETLKDQERMESCRQIVDRRREYWEMGVTNFRLGHIDTTDIPIMEEYLVRAKIDLHETAQRYRTSRLILNVLLNRPGGDNLVLDKTEFDAERMVALSRRFDDYTENIIRQNKLEQFLVATAVENSQAMNTSQIAVGLQKDLLSGNKNRFLPEISLRAKYSYADEFEPAISEKSSTWTLGGKISFPLFNGGAGIKQGQSLRAGMEALLYSRDTLRFALWREVTLRASDLATRTSTLPMRYFVKNQSVDNLKVIAGKYFRNDIHAIELMIFEEKATEAELLQIANRYDLFISYAGLLHSIGVDYLIFDSDEAAEFYDRLDKYMKK